MRKHWGDGGTSELAHGLAPLDFGSVAEASAMRVLRILETVLLPEDWLSACSS